jgi:hypothetical protein
VAGNLTAGSYTLTGSSNVNGGSGQVLAGNYVVPAPPVALNLGSTPALRIISATRQRLRVPFRIHATLQNRLFCKSRVTEIFQRGI